MIPLMSLIKSSDHAVHILIPLLLLLLVVIRPIRLIPIRSQNFLIVPFVMRAKTVSLESDTNVRTVRIMIYANPVNQKPRRSMIPLMSLPKSSDHAGALILIPLLLLQKFIPLFVMHAINGLLESAINVAAAMIMICAKRANQKPRRSIISNMSL